MLPPALTDPASEESIASVMTPADRVSRHPSVNIIVHPEPVEVTYETVRALVPILWEGGLQPQPRKIDYMIHLGMATGRDYFTIETCGSRDGYAYPDANGEFLGDGDRRRKEGDNWIWAGLPERLETDLNTHQILLRWRRALTPEMELNLRISENAGKYLCDFIYYSSLAHCTKLNERKRVCGTKDCHVVS